MRELCDNFCVAKITMFAPKFTITNKILKNIAEIEACRQVIENAPLVPAWEAKFRQEAIVRTVHFGTHIEGNPLNFTQAREVLEGRPISARDRDIQEIINYRNVLKYMDRIGKQTKGEIDEEIILTIHKLTTEKILPKEWYGKYRLEQAVIRNSKTGQISFVASLALQVPSLVKNFLFWLNSAETSELHPVLRAGIAHYELARIHPFVDGNGRTARAVATLILFRADFDVKRFFSLEEYFDKNAQGYYAALQSVVPPDFDLTKWLEYFTEGLAQELVQVRERVQRLSVDLKLKGRVGQVALSERQIKLVEYIQNYGQIANPQWRRLLGEFSDDTILRDLRDLMRKKLIRKKGKTKAAIYMMR